MLLRQARITGLFLDADAVSNQASMGLTVCWKGSGITMKLECNRSALAAAFGAVGAVIPSRTPKPILQNAKLQVAGGKTTLIGTDSEIAIRYDVPDVDCKGSGEALLADETGQ